MNVTDTVEIFSASGGLLCAAAAWIGLWSPRAKASKEARADKARRDREIHEALFGRPERRDDAEELIAVAQPGLLASMAALTSLPILNGKGTMALRQIADMSERLGSLEAKVGRIDGRTLAYGRRLTAIERTSKGGRDA